MTPRTRKATGDMPVAIMPNLGQVTLLQVDGIYTRENSSKRPSSSP